MSGRAQNHPVRSARRESCPRHHQALAGSSACFSRNLGWQAVAGSPRTRGGPGLTPLAGNSTNAWNVNFNNGNSNNNDITNTNRVRCVR